MQDRYFTVYPALDTVPPPTPERSRLYPLQPIGFGTPYCESLIGYLHRLAFSHSVPVQKLISLILKKRWPLTKRQLNKTVAIKQLVISLEELTGIQNLKPLTSLAWSNVFPFHFGLYEERCRWCPLCYEQWAQEGKVIYHPILWTFNKINICFLHNISLSYCCIKCLDPLKNPFFNMLVHPLHLGYCPRCGSWLGSANLSSDSKISNYFNKNQLWNRYIYTNLCHLIAANIHVVEPTDRVRISNVLKTFFRFNK